MLSHLSIEGRMYLITGASSGIGRSSAVAVSQAGGRVALCARNEERLRETFAALSGEGHRIYTQDMEDVDSIESLVKRINTDMGPLDGVVHSAGIAALCQLRDTNLADVDRMLRVNYTSFVALCKAACRRGRYNPGGMSVVAISSIAHLTPRPGLSTYAASKAALSSAVGSFSREYARRNIRFNAICPNFVDTPMAKEGVHRFLGDENFGRRVESELPLGMIEPDDVADSVVFLLSDASRRITGISLVIDSGFGAE